MPKIHYFQRYSSVENTVTNNTLQLFARVYAYSTTQASQLLTNLTGESIEIGVEINQQEREKGAVPDGVIIQRSFKILIESKVDSPVSIDQLLRHAANFSDEQQKILLLLTKHQVGRQEDTIREKITAQYPDVIFKNITYEGICQAIDPLFQVYEYEMRSLVEDYKEYCNDVGLFDQSQYLMRIVPCGKSLDINRRYGIYFHPSDRGYTQHQFVGMYKDKAVQVLFKIDSVFDVHYDRVRLKKTLVQGRDTDEFDAKLVEVIKEAEAKCGYEVAANHRFFCGFPIATNYIKSSANGLQGARLVNLKEIIGNFSEPSEVAQKLAGREWQ
ncbi:hypothetical protein NIES2135_44700 [Leptolyngbya boryana NIES-2135]|jgi:hypothetical protein|uniref:Uncharacterized protein n=1 Tax=Leptolyngbya boryana NIES-2135 TaxID=1973484 RepID=A0A1Z4JLL4_LEPBY|nr:MULTISPECIES: hypothetical protein [Leptolyngbya]BAY57600.1 hypothetical protein NIES2135_44700 [Leptolyngbya boryana NIES-2135]MBD2367556.1 hypothetical protein [Leptolyngbya sp. FACHB-161]MBD2374080.1 hypothetical protein [Leptolyngbya sp. FACHB-238]MBD2398705.1 hypothetical protein [Leptolyngbya sp. FACHB-239]MBD2404929.1 hypothetical protein [Leptolyngbya sp. FACHB-402]